MTQWHELIDILLSKICDLYIDENDDPNLKEKVKTEFRDEVEEFLFINSGEFEKFDIGIPGNIKTFGDDDTININVQNEEDNSSSIFNVLNVDTNEEDKDSPMQMYEKYLENKSKNKEKLLKYFTNVVKNSEVGQKIEDYIENEKNDPSSPKNFMKFLSAHYDLSDVKRDYYDINDVLKFIENNPMLVEIAKYFGYSNKSPQRRMHISNSPENTVGVKTGNDLAIVLPHQLALRNKELASKIFKIGYIEKKLQQLDQKGISYGTDDKGPIIILLDTSGSMYDYLVLSKAIALVITKNAILTKRNCYLMSFSTELEIIDLTSKKNGAVELLKFLSMSFNGGTVIEYVLEKVIDIMGTDKNFKHSDVVIISDMYISPISNKMSEKISNLKSNTNFYGVATRSEEGEMDESIKQIYTDIWYVVNTWKSIDAFSKKIIERFTKKKF